MKRTVKAQASDQQGGTLPPYVSFNTVKNLIDDFKQNTVPSPIDSSVMRNLSGTVRGQLVNALKYLQLIDYKNCPNDQLKTLVSAYKTDNWGASLSEVIVSAYPKTLIADLGQASPAQFYNNFAQLYGGTTEVRKKCIRFFVRAAREAGMQVSPRNSFGTKRRGLNTTSTNSVKPKIMGKSRTKGDRIKQFVGFFELAKLDPPEKDAFYILLTYLQKNG